MFNGVLRKVLLGLVSLAFAELAAAQSCTEPPGGAAEEDHGLGVTKAAMSPASVGDTYKIRITIRNALDTAEDTLVVNSVVDTFTTAAGPQNTGNVLGLMDWTLSNGASCDFSDPANPECSLPFVGEIQSSFYDTGIVIQAGDFLLNPDHRVNDTAVIEYMDLCDGVCSTNCNVVDAQTLSAGSSTLIEGCGDNLVNEPGETCDGTDDDGCSEACRSQGSNDPCTCCGDEIVQGDSDESCDPPGSEQSNGNICGSSCTYCGDGNEDPGEQCDDGNSNDNDLCSNNCTEGCGNGIVNTGESCDGADFADGSACDPGSCRANCTCCGDGVDNGPPAEETCDDGDNDNEDTCRNDCSFCGDGNQDPGEFCDDGNTNNNDACSNNCTGGCGNGFLNLGESCDGTVFAPGSACNPGSCRADCTCCGDGADNGPPAEETCDDGDNDNEDTCRNDCSFCGDGNQDPGEFCDDGNTNNNDACSNDCTGGCGNGFLNPGENCDGAVFAPGSACEAGTCRIDCTCCGDGADNGPPAEETCDDGDNDNEDTCRNDCSFCGDGNQDPGEFCDDGNNNNNDACSNNCTAGCGNGFLNPGESCDGGQFAPESACEPGTCRIDCSCCGDGDADTGAGELCDDGNNNNLNDSCRNDCTPPLCGDGILDPGEECDDGPANSDLPGTPCSTDCELNPCFNKPIIKCDFDEFAHTDGECGVFVWVDPPAVSDFCVEDEDILIVSHVTIGPDGNPGPYPNCLASWDLECGEITRVPCWDLSGNGICDIPQGPGTGEDLNGDNLCTQADCDCVCPLSEEADPNDLPPQIGSDDGGCFDASAADCPPQPTTCDYDASAFYPVGTTTIIWTVYNPETELRAQCEQKVWVGDADAPVLQCNGHEEFVNTLCNNQYICKSDLIHQIPCRHHGDPVIEASDNCKHDCPEFPGDPNVLDYEIFLHEHGVETEITDSVCLGLGVHWLRIRAKDCAKEHDPTTESEFPDPNFSEPCDVLTVVIPGTDCPDGGNTGGDAGGDGGDAGGDGGSGGDDDDDNTTGGGGSSGGGGSGGGGSGVVIITPPGGGTGGGTTPGTGGTGGGTTPDTGGGAGGDQGTEQPGDDGGSGQEQPDDGNQVSPSAQRMPPAPSDGASAAEDAGSAGGVCGLGASSSLMLLLALTLMKIRHRRP